MCESDVDGVVTVWRMAQHTDKQYVVEEGRSQPEVLLGFGWCKSKTLRVRNGVAGEQCNSATRTGFRSIKTDETLARETQRSRVHPAGRRIVLNR